MIKNKTNPVASCLNHPVEEAALQAY